MDPSLAQSEGPTPAIADLTVPLADTEIVERLDALSRRGKLAEFTPAGHGGLFAITAFGAPFDHVLVATAAAGDGGTTLRFSLKMLPRMPWIFAVILAFTVWPGVWLTDSMIRTYWTGYDVRTWLWYLPITVLPIPWMWAKMVRKSRAAAAQHAAEIVERVRAALMPATG